MAEDPQRPDEETPETSEGAPGPEIEGADQLAGAMQPEPAEEPAAEEPPVEEPAAEEPVAEEPRGAEGAARRGARGR